MSSTGPIEDFQAGVAASDVVRLAREASGEGERRVSPTISHAGSHKSHTSSQSLVDSVANTNPMQTASGKTPSESPLSSLSSGWRKSSSETPLERASSSPGPTEAATGHQTPPNPQAAASTSPKTSPAPPVILELTTDDVLMGTSLDVQIDPALMNLDGDGSGEAIDVVADIVADEPLDLPATAEASKLRMENLTESVGPFVAPPKGMQLRPIKTESLADKWAIDTSAPPSASTDSPATSIGYSIPGFSPTASSFDFSRQSSVSDFTGPGEGKGTESSESEYNPAGSGRKGGVPPPKKSHARKQPPGHIKRARNAFILFRKHVTDTGLIPPSVEVKHQNISVVAAKMWREAPHEVRQKFQEQARLEKEEHQRLYPGYRYQPVFRRTDIIRRRVRKDPAEDEKVEAVAEALIKGKAGQELEEEIKDQMVQRSEAESDADSSRSSSSRRRRRDAGQLSKGALRAQRAQNRAKQMRQNLLGANLLNMSMYNAQAQQQRIAQHHTTAHGYQHGGTHTHTHPGMQYAMTEAAYVPMGYDMDGRPFMSGGYVTGPEAADTHDVYSDDVYRLPPIMGYDNPAGAGWETDGSGSEHWQAGGSTGEKYIQMDQNGVFATGGTNEFGEFGAGMEYRLPTLLDPGHLGMDINMNGTAGPSTLRPGENPGGQFAVVRGPAIGTAPSAGPGGFDAKGMDSRMREWVGEAQQTPSGHVMFNERLFDGALGTAGLADEGLGAFDEAVQQTNDMPSW